MIASNAFSPHEPGIFGPIWDTLLPRGDHYMHLADLAAYVKAQDEVGALYLKPEAWTRRAVAERGAFGQVLERPHDRAVRKRDLEGQAVSRRLRRSICDGQSSPGGSAGARERLDRRARARAAYHANRPDPADPRQRVDFGTSGHRGTSLDHTFTESHILAITQAICDYREANGIDGPLFLGKDTHALSGPAQRTALEVLAARGRRDDPPARRRRDADAGDLARDPGLQLAAAPTTGATAS